MSNDDIRSVPVYIAAMKCWMARGDPPDMGGPLVRMTSQHGAPCRFCDFSTDYLRMMIQKGQAWIDFNGGTPITEFEKMPLVDQRRLVAEAARIDDTGLATVSG